MNLTPAEKTFLLHLLHNWVTHPNKIGWVNPLDRDEVFSHEQMVNLQDKVTLN
jgi:hypothetical protein